MRYIENLRTILNRYANSVRKEAEAMKNARKIYQPSVAEEEIKNRLLNVHALAHEAKAAIEAEKEATTKSLNNWGILKGDEVKTGDMALLNENFDLTGKDITDMINRNWSNATMLRAISNYYNRVVMADHENAIRYALEIPEIPTLERRLEAVSKFAKMATELVGIAESDPESLMSYDENLSSVSMQFEGFGTPGLSPKKDLFVLGYGK